MPNPSKSSIESNLNTVFLTLAIKLQLSEGLSSKPGIQTLKVRFGVSNYLQSGIPLDLVISFIPSETLITLAPVGEGTQ
eukprot:34081-Amphidinium_carterae.1